jgi:hypothetical protein
MGRHLADRRSAAVRLNYARRLRGSPRRRGWSKRGPAATRRLRSRVTAHMFRFACAPPPPRPPRNSTSPPSSRSSPRSSAGSPISIDGGRRTRQDTPATPARTPSCTVCSACSGSSRARRGLEARSQPRGCGSQSSSLIAPAEPAPAAAVNARAGRPAGSCCVVARTTARRPGDAPGGFCAPPAGAPPCPAKRPVSSSCSRTPSTATPPSSGTRARSPRPPSP